MAGKKIRTYLVMTVTPLKDGGNNYTIRRVRHTSATKAARCVTFDYTKPVVLPLDDVPRLIRRLVEEVATR